MSTVNEFSEPHTFDPKVIEQEAVEWLIKLDSDTAPSAQNLAAIKEWMARSPAHSKELESLGAFWADLMVLTELSAPVMQSTTAAVADKQSRTKAVASKWRWSQNRWAQLASVLGLALLLQQMLLPDWLRGIGFDQANGYHSTAIGEQNTVSLPDGTAVRLNTNSQIRVDYTEGYRNIRLVHGEAYFDVAKDKSKPFRVYAGEGRIQAVGTAFTVYLRAQDVAVLVTEGKVELAAQKAKPSAAPAVTNISESAPPKMTNSQLTAVTDSPPSYFAAMPVEKLGVLAAGQGATILTAQHNDLEDGQQSRDVKLMDPDTLKQRDAWREGLLLFTGNSLEEVVAEISRYTSVKIEIVDPELKKIRIGGQFRTGDLDGMFDVLEANFRLSINMLDGQRVQITAAKTKNNTK